MVSYVLLCESQPDDACPSNGVQYGSSLLFISLFTHLAKVYVCGTSQGWLPATRTGNIPKLLLVTFILQVLKHCLKLQINTRGGKKSAVADLLEKDSIRIWREGISKKNHIKRIV